MSRWPWVALAALVVLALANAFQGAQERQRLATLARVQADSLSALREAATTLQRDLRGARSTASELQAQVSADSARLVRLTAEAREQGREARESVERLTAGLGARLTGEARAMLDSLDAAHRAEVDALGWELAATRAQLEGERALRESLSTALAASVRLNEVQGGMLARADSAIALYEAATRSGGFLSDIWNGIRNPVVWVPAVALAGVVLTR